MCLFPLSGRNKGEFHSQASILAFQIQSKAQWLGNFLSQGQHVSKNIDHHSHLVYDHLIFSVWDGASLLVRLMFTVCQPSLGIQEALAHHPLAPGCPMLGQVHLQAKRLAVPGRGCLCVCNGVCIHSHWSVLLFTFITLTADDIALHLIENDLVILRPEDMKVSPWKQ